MSQLAFADRNDEMQDFMNFLFTPDKKLLCYRCEPGYGISAFFHRIGYILQSTPSVLYLYAELSDNSRSPLHTVLRSMVINNDSLSQTIQLYTDERYGECTQTLFKSILLDIPQFGETLAHLLTDRPTALPVYSGYYSDALKQVFFGLVKEQWHDKTIALFIDNAQFIDNESIYDILALTEMRNIKTILSKTGDSVLLDKLLLELGIREHLEYYDFSEPSIRCIKEIWASQTKEISDVSARDLILRSNGNMREIIYSSRNGTLPSQRNRSLLSNEVLSLFQILGDEAVDMSGIQTMLKGLPSYIGQEDEEIASTVHTLVHMGFLSFLMQMNGNEVFQKRVRKENREIWNALITNQADQLVYQDVAFRYMVDKDRVTFDEMQIIFELASSVAPYAIPLWGRRLVSEGLRLGVPIQIEWIEAARTISAPECQFMCAIALFRLWKYQDARTVLESIWSQIKEKRDAKILYALTLNRCRSHDKADEILWELINSGNQTDEKAVLLSISISNSVHNGKEDEAMRTIQDYSDSIKTSGKYGYFLRNAATLFQGKQALQYWENALTSFQAAKDEYGELTTMVNMSRAYIKKGASMLARKNLEYAYERLMPYGIQQLHIAANNLGIANFYCHDLINAKRYLRIARLIAKSVMPRVYITINDCCVMLEEGNRNKALQALLTHLNEVEQSQLPRLKGRYFLALAGMYCLCGKREEALRSLCRSDSYTSSFPVLREHIRSRCDSSVPLYEVPWIDYFAPAFLEYWISNPLSIMSAEVLAD